MKTRLLLLGMVLAASAALPAPGRAQGPPSDELGDDPELLDIKEGESLSDPDARKRPEAPPSSPAARRGGGDLREYGLKELLESALTRNLEIQSQNHSIVISHRELQYARSQQLPILTLATSFLDSNTEDRLDLLKPANRLDRLFGALLDSHSLVSGVDLKVPIYQGHSVSHLPEAARVAEVIEVTRRDLLRQDLTVRLVEAYTDLLVEDRELTLAREKLAKSVVDLEDVKQRLKSDVTLSQEVLKVELEMDEINQQILESENQVVLLQQRIVKMAGLPRDVPFSLVQGIKMKDLELDVKALVAGAAQDSVKLKLLKQTVDLAGDRVKIADGEDSPRLDLDVNYYNHHYFPESNHDADQYSVALRYTWDLYDGGRDRHLLQKARAVRDKAMTDLENATQDLETDIRQVHNKYVEARKLLDRAQRNIRLARENLKLVGDRVKANLLKRTDLMAARVNLTRAEVNRDRVLGNIIKARTGLYRLVGRLTPDVFQE